MNLELKNKVMLIAGASKGLGFAIADSLADEGAYLSLCSSNAARIESAAAVLSAKTTTLSSACDLADPEDIEQWVQKTLKHYGRIDGLVINAGGPKPGQFSDFSDADWINAFNLTLMSAVRLVKAVLPTLQQQQSGSILFLTSSSVKEPIDTLLLSNVMRSGVASLAKSLSRTEAKYGIRVNCLVPGIIATDRIAQLDNFQATAQGIDLSQQRQQREAFIPLQRYGEPTEFAKAASFLLSDAASYITGSTLVVDGGSMRSV